MFLNKLKQRKVYVTILLVTGIVCIILFSLQKPEEQSLIVESSAEEQTTNKIQTVFNSSYLFKLKFKYVLDAEPCDNNISIIIIVTSYFGDVETRSAMRRAFSSEKLQNLNIKRVFLLGITSDNKYTTQSSVIDESKRFKDIVQGNFQESYRNLTYKHVMGHKWVSEYCMGAKYVIKMDDDIVVNIYKMLEMLDLLKLPLKNLLAGYILNDMKVIRKPANKWYVTFEEYSKQFYPPFLSGWFYISNPEVSSEIFRHSFSMPYFWIDDVYITGEIANSLGILHVDLKRYFAVHSELLQCCIADVKRQNLECDIIVGPNGGDNNLFYTFNKAMEPCFKTRCKKREKLLNNTCVVQKQDELGEGKALISNFHLF